MVPEAGLEPAQYRYRQILSLVRLPFRHSGNRIAIYHTANQPINANLLLA